MNPDTHTIHRFKRRSKGKPNRFEGWYLRITDTEKDVNMAFILAETGFMEDAHAFMQVFDGHAGTNRYIRFERDAFAYADDAVVIADNRLSLERASFDVEGVRLDVKLSAHKTITGKSAMDYMASLPLQCYQEVVFMDAVASGVIEIDGKLIELSGNAYMEKTYGHRFPKKWFWLQANRFSGDIRLSVAGGRVPTLFFRPFGFFAICQVGEEEFVFNTPRLSKARIGKTVDDAIRLAFKRRDMTLELVLERGPTTTLVGPADKGKMSLDVEESLSSSVSLVLKRGNTIVAEDISGFAGSEWMFD